MLEIDKIYFEDCLEGMKRIDAGSIDMILCDLPFGTTGCKWDVIIPFEPLWEQYKRVIKERGSILLWGVQPFASLLAASNLEWFRYEWIWNKTRGGNFQQANFAPMKCHEQILMFSKLAPIYNKRGSPYYYPQKTAGDAYVSRMGNAGNIVRPGNSLKKISTNQEGRYPLSIQEFKKDYPKIHPTQKPIALCEYLIKTYTLEGELVLDNCIGSGTTPVACINTGRHFIGFENDPRYYPLAVERIEKCRDGMV